METSSLILQLSHGPSLAFTQNYNNALERSQRFGARAFICGARAVEIRLRSRQTEVNDCMILQSALCAYLTKPWRREDTP